MSKKLVLVLSATLFLFLAIAAFAPGFGDVSPDVGTADAGNVVNSTGASNYIDGNFTSTQSDDDVYFTVGRNNPDGTANQLEAFINFTYNLTPIAAVNTQPQFVVQLIFNISYCHNRDVTSPSTCGSPGAQGTANTMDAEIYNWSSNSYVDIGDIAVSNNEVLATFYVNGSFADFANSTNNLVNIRYEVNYTLGSGNDAVFSIDFAPLTVIYDNVTPSVTLNNPANGFNITANNLTANFTAIDNNATLSCSVILNNVVNQTNTSVANNTLTNFVLNALGHGNYNWGVNCTDRINTGSSATRTFFVNRTPTLPSISDSPDPIKGGNVIAITANDAKDPNNDTLNFFCATNSTPTAANTLCTGGVTTDTTAPYALNCTFVTAVTDTANTVFCRAFDGESYSAVRNTTYTTDSTQPSTTVANVANDTAAAYFDSRNDGTTNITVNGEASMSCRFSTSDLGYSSMTNDCTISASQAFCTITTLTQGNYTIYVSCRDSVGNEQNSTNNLDVAFTLDYTAPNTTDNALTTIQLPGYNVTTTESDNIDGDPDTLFCTDTANTCTPDLVIDNGGRVTFNARGIKYLRYNSTDDAGNSQSIQSRTITVNRLPTLTSASDNAVTIKGGSTINITTVSSSEDAGQNITLYACKTDSADFSGCSNSTNTYCSANGTANASCTFAAETDNTEHFWFAFVFDALNESAGASKSGSYITDSTAPSMTITSPANTTLSQNSATAEIVISEIGDVASYCLDSCQSNTTMTKVSSTLFTASLSNLSNGARLITFYVNDTVGNLANTTRAFTVDTTLQDTTAPTVTVRSPLNGTYLNTTSIPLNITADESLSIAEYSINGTMFQPLVNYTGTQWNRTITMNEGVHNATFRGNDTSGNKNRGNSSLIFFFVDVTNPQNSTTGFTPSEVNDTSNITCSSSWADNVALDVGFVEYNISGAFVNSTNTTFNGTSGVLNITFAANSSLGSVGCRFYAFDKAGNLNRTALLTTTVTDTTNPGFENLTYTPNTTAQLDPNVRVNFTINATDNRAVSNATVKYRLVNESYTTALMSLVSGNGYNASIVFAEGNWTFRINITDINGNSNTTGEINISVFNDETFVNVTTIPAIKSFVLSERASNSTLGNLTLNNTADFDLNFTITATSSGGRVTLNRTTNTTFAITLPRNNVTTISVGANTSDLSAGLYNYSIFIEARRNPVIGTTNLTLQINIQNVAGPLIDASIDAFDSDVTLGEIVDLVSSVTNFGTGDATGVHLSWSIPENWSVVSGNLTRNIGTLAPGVKATNSIKVSIGGGNGTFTISTTANSTEGSTDTDSKTVDAGTVAVVTQTQTQVVSQPSGGGGAGARIFTIDLQHVPRFAINRKETSGFFVNVTNPNRLTKLVNVTLTIEGYPQTLITVSPSSAGIEFNKTASFFVEIRVPAYIEAQEYQLTLKAKAVAITASSSNVIEKSSRIVLSVQSLNASEAKRSLIGAEKAIGELELAGIESKTISDLLEKAKQAIGQEDYETANDIAARIHELKQEILEARVLLKDVEKKIAEAEFNGIEIPETRKLYELAKTAFEREDYRRAAERATNALLTYPLETRGKANYLKLVQNWWWAFLIATFAAAYSGFLGYRKMMLLFLDKRLASLTTEEITVRDLLEKVKKDYFVEKSIGRIEYHRSIYEYEKRLAKVKKNIIKAISRRVGLLNFEDAAKILENEDYRVVEAIKDAQRKYFELGSITKADYEKTMAVLRSERAEIMHAREIANTRQDAAKKSKIYQLMSETRNFFDLLIKFEEKMESQVKVMTKLLPQQRRLPKRRLGYYDINRGWQPQMAQKASHHAKSVAYKFGPLALVLVSFALIFFAGASITGFVTNPEPPVEGALEAIKQAELAVNEMQILGFGIERANDTLAEARLFYQKGDYSQSRQLALSVVALKEKAIATDKHIDDFDLRLYESEKNGTNAIAARLIFNDAVSAFNSEQYEKSEQLLQEASRRLADIESEEARQRALRGAEFDAARFIKDNWLQILGAALVFSFAALLIYRRLEIKLTVRKLHRLEQRKEVTENLLRDIQKKYFGSGIISKGDYETSRRRYERKLIKIKKDIPMLKNKIADLSKRRL